MMSKQRTLIFFGAHPDDETFGMGSTLALYALRGLKVYCVCSSGGEEGTVDPQLMKGYATIADLRSDELKCAAKALGLADVIFLGYRDSGMRGSASSRLSTNIAINRAGWSSGINSSRVGGSNHVCCLFKERNGILISLLAVTLILSQLHATINTLLIM
jgi:LmbE family N-acetylglucosaminyl deacetylase